MAGAGVLAGVDFIKVFLKSLLLLVFSMHSHHYNVPFSPGTSRCALRLRVNKVAFFAFNGNVHACVTGSPHTSPLTVCIVAIYIVVSRSLFSFLLLEFVSTATTSHCVATFLMWACGLSVLQFHSIFP